MTIPKFQHSDTGALESWTNYSGSLGKHKVPLFCKINGNADAPNGLKQHAAAVSEILKYCFAEGQPPQLRTIGSTWSFSQVLQPGKVLVDPGNMYRIEGVPQQHLTDSYKVRREQGYRPVFVEGGTGIGTLNATLGRHGLSLQTSGAGNGHRIAGCIATGTHGSAIQIGALHDTVLAMHLIVAPDRAVLVQSRSAPVFQESAAAWLARRTGIATELVTDDNAIAAARVALGSLGFVFGVIVEAARLYRFQIKRLARPASDPALMHAIRTLDTSALHPAELRNDKPYHFDIVMHPYPPAGSQSWFATLMWKRTPANLVYKGPLQGIPRSTIDVMGLIGALADTFGDGLPGAITFEVVRSQILKQLAGDAKPEDDEAFAGQVFGPTTLPRGRGASTEIVVDHAQVEATLDTVREVLDAERRNGNFLLGVVALRFVPETRSLLGMNQSKMNCFIELPSIRNDAVLQIYRSLWAALDQKNIKFTCHWGQMGGFTPARVQRYYGPRADAWKAARKKLLGSDTAMQIFEAAILREAGLR